MSSPTNTTPNTAADKANGERRRSSGGLFNNLLSQKRSPDNAAYSARRQSIEDQGPKPGMLGKLWNSAVKGVAPESSK